MTKTEEITALTVARFEQDQRIDELETLLYGAAMALNEKSSEIFKSLGLDEDGCRID